MPNTISNNNVKLAIDNPEENYLGSRFDWTCKIISATYKGFAMSGLEKPTLKESKNFGKAFYSEFGIDGALGFEETNIGDWFHKIGVGLLKKTDAVYDFAHEYEIKPCEFNVTNTKDNFIIRCIAPMNKGYRYELERKISLQESGFKVSSKLINTGTKPIETNEYCHNFLAINRALIGANYVLSFPFELKENNFDANVNPNNVVRFSDNSLTFNTTPTSDVFFSNINLGQTTRATWELRHIKDGLGIRETASFKADKINVWGCSHVLSPELFFDIQLESKESVEWSRVYDFFEAR